MSNAHAANWLENEVFQQNVEIARGEVNTLAASGRENFAQNVANAVADAHPNADKVAALIFFASKMYPSLVTEIVSAAVTSAPDSAASIVYVATTVVPVAAPDIITAALTAAPEKALTATHAAVSAAPHKTLSIVTAAVTTVPQRAGEIAYAAIFANPPLGDQIVAAAKAVAPGDTYGSIDQALATARSDLNAGGQYAFTDSYKRYNFDDYLEQKGAPPAQVAEGEENVELDDRPGENAYFEQGTLENKSYGSTPPPGKGNGSSSAASPS
jgi:hypothetical protein